MYARRGRVKRICSKCQPILIMLYIFMIWQPWKSRSQNTLSNSLCLRQFWGYQSADKMSYISSYAEEHLRSWLKQSGINAGCYESDQICMISCAVWELHLQKWIMEMLPQKKAEWNMYPSLWWSTLKDFDLIFFTEKEYKNTSTYIYGKTITYLKSLQVFKKIQVLLL